MRNICYILISFLLCQHILCFSQTWNPLGTDPNGCVVFALKEWSNKLYVGGCLSVNNNLIQGVASFNGQKFDSLGIGFQSGGGAYAFTKYNNILYAGGAFSSVGGISNSACVAGWNDTNWLSAGNNYYDQIHAIASYNGELYVGGLFSQIGGINAYRIAKWNGTTWSTVGTSFTGQCEIKCMAVYSGELYVGGQLGLPGGPNYFYNLVRWNGTQWDSVGGKFGGGYVTSLCVDTINNLLYIGGGITYAGTIPIWSVAKWDGTNLSSPGGFGITDGAHSMCIFNNELYVGGSGFSDTTLAKYDGVSWLPVSPSPNYDVEALAVYDSNLYVGGYFTQIGPLNANYIACYGNSCPQGVGVNEVNKPQLKFKVYPNPAKNNITIETQENKIFVVHITNPLGQQVIKKSFNKKTEVDVSSYGKGLFLVEVCNEKGVKCHTQKLMIE